MKKLFSLVIGASLALSVLPALAKNENSSSSAASSSSSLSSSASSVSSVSTSSTSSLSSSSVSLPCTDVEIAERPGCLRTLAKLRVEKRKQRQNTAAHERVAACKDATGLAKALCLRQRIQATKQAKTEQKNLRQATRRTLILQHKLLMQARKRLRQSSRSSSSSSVSSSSVSSSSVTSTGSSVSSASSSMSSSSVSSQ